MILRYLSINKPSPLVDLGISFSQETLLGNKNVMHCFTGLNGSGKTLLLQSLGNIVGYLVGKKDGSNLVSLPNFALKLLYDIKLNGKFQTIYFRHYPESAINSNINDDSNDVLPSTEIIVFKESLKNISKSEELNCSYEDPRVEKWFSIDIFLDLEDLKPYLPNKLVVYTTGRTVSWEKLFNNPVREKRLNDLSPLIKEDELKLAICALALGQKIVEESNFGGLLTRLGMFASVEISFELDLPEFITKKERSTVNWLEQIATRITHVPNSIKQEMVFDFGVVEPSIDKLEIFNQLRKWYQLGQFKNLTLLFNKNNETGHQITYDDLSEGQAVLLGQTALLSLLEGNNGTLLLLDEPEKLFNDYWKREVVDIINQSLGQTACTVVFTTNSALLLTDLLEGQISLMNQIEGTLVAVEKHVRTFAACPIEMMRDMFDCKATGNLATKYLNDVLSIVNECNASDQRKLKELIHKLEIIEEQLGAGYFQMEFRLRLKALRKLVSN